MTGPAPLAAIEARIETLRDAPGLNVDAAAELLRLGEQVLEAWVLARGEEPTRDSHEGFRLLALHRQGARGEPSFNACRETCRELAYHYNLVTMAPDHPDAGRRLKLMAMVALHLYLFVAGKMQVAKLGEFCCSARPLHAKAAAL
ncbi:MAG TPA: hypothetical protein VGA19_05705 [Rhodospirillales bacterium]|jgi:hypothetical protein